MKILQEVIQEEPENAFAYFEMGVMYYLSGRFSEGICVFEYAASLHSSMLQSSNVYISYAKRILDAFNEAETAFNSGNYVEAMRVLNRALKIDESNESVKKVADGIFASFMTQVIQMMENRVLGVDENQNILTEVPDDKDIEIEKMIVNDQLVEAEQMLPPAGFPINAQQCYLKGLLRYHYGEVARAHWYFDEALKIDEHMQKAKDMKEKSRMLVEMMGDATEDMKAQRYQIAIEKLNGALEIDPTNARVVQGIYFQRAGCKFQQGQIKAAFKDYLEFEALEKVTGMMKGDKKLKADESNSIQRE